MIDVGLLKTTSGLLKSINVVVILIALAIFFSSYSDWTQLVGTTIVSGLIYTLSLIIIYGFGGRLFQKTYYELMMNGYYAAMFFIAAIVNWTYGNAGGIPVATGIFCLFSFIIFAIDNYFALVNLGILKKSEISVPPILSQQPDAHGTNQSSTYLTPSFPTVSVSNPSAFPSGPAVLLPVPSAPANNSLTPSE